MIPWIAAHQFLCPWDSPGNNTGVGCHSLVQEIFPIKQLAAPIHIPTHIVGGFPSLHTLSSIHCVQTLWSQIQQYVNRELPDVQAGFRKGRRTRDQIANIRWIIKKARELQKNIYFCFIDHAKVFVCMDHNKLWIILKEMGNQTTWPASWETYMQVRKQHLELDMEQQTGSK